MRNSLLRLLISMVLFAAAATPDATAAEAKKNAAANKPPATVPAPPPPPENYNPPATPQTPEQELEPEVTITTKGTEIHEEYRVNGKLYMVKVIPAKGKPYYLIDHEGSGKFRRSDLEPAVSIPNWVIKRF